MENKQRAVISIPTGWLICIVLIVLKATGYIGMGWFWVITSFIWVPLAIVAIITSIMFVIALIAVALGG